MLRAHELALFWELAEKPETCCLEADDFPTALMHLAGFPLRRMPIAPRLERMWQLRRNTTAYDAACVALAERLESPLITSDVKADDGKRGPLLL